jgi:hypothetical protein
MIFLMKGSVGKEGWSSEFRNWGSMSGGCGRWNSRDCKWLRKVLLGLDLEGIKKRLDSIGCCRYILRAFQAEKP